MTTEEELTSERRPHRMRLPIHISLLPFLAATVPSSFLKTPFALYKNFVMSKTRKRSRAEALLFGTDDNNNNNSIANNNASASMLPPPFVDPSSRGGCNRTNHSVINNSSRQEENDGFVLGSRLATTPTFLVDQTKTTAAAAAAAAPTTPLSAAGNNSNDYCPGLFGDKNSRSHTTMSSSMPTSNSSTLFGRVMQQSAQKLAAPPPSMPPLMPPPPFSPPPKQKNNSNSSIPGNNSNTNSNNSNGTFQTPTKAKRPSAAATNNLLTPGGFNLQNAVQAAVASSPFAFRSFAAADNSNSGGAGSNLSCATPVRQPAWRVVASSGTTTTPSDSLPRDWSLKEKLVLQSSAFDVPSAWRWMQRNLVVVDVPANNKNNNNCGNQQHEKAAIYKWHAARTHWQYPLVQSKSSSFGLFSAMEQSQSNILSTTSMEASKTVFSKMESRAEKTLSASEQAWQQLQYPPTAKASTAEKEWQTALASLYHCWRRRAKQDDAGAYFYCRGQDHTTLFYYHDNQPTAMISSCNKQFRLWFESQGVTLKIGHAAENTEDWCEETSLSRWKDPGKAASMSPPSPALAAELAALRRAHVYGKTVGADVSVSVRSKGAGVNLIAAQRRALQQVPPLLAVGTDACDALVEYYLNTRGQMVGPISYLPCLLAPSSMGPFCHASLQTATVRLFPGRVEVHGTLLPDGVRDLVGSAVHALGEHLEDGDDDDDDGRDRHVRLEAKSTAHRVAAPMVRPLDEAVVGQANLFSLDEDVGELVSQVVWDSDQPDSISYKVDTAALTFVQ